MNDFRLTQSYLLCQMNDKGKLASGTPQFALGIATLLELLQNDCITINKEMVLKSPPPKDLCYLTEVYQFMQGKKTRKLDKMMSDVCFSDKLLKNVKNSCCETLVEQGYFSQTTTKGLFDSSKTRFIPKTESQDLLIETIRSAVLSGGVISGNTAVLISLLEKSGKLKEYFSKHEKTQLKSCIKELRTNKECQLVFRWIEQIEEFYVTVICCPK
ncbi:MAG: GPP34 family phosphoprotein [Eubacteriales bacterium]